MQGARATAQKNIDTCRCTQCYVHFNNTSAKVNAQYEYIQYQDMHIPAGVAIVAAAAAPADIAVAVAYEPYAEEADVDGLAVAAAEEPLLLV